VPSARHLLRSVVRDSHSPLSRSLLGAVLLSVGLLGVGCTGSEPLPRATPSNPLPPCPDRPNCERITTDSPLGVDSLFARAREALQALGPARLEADPDSLRAAAVYRVAWVFRDDVVVAVTPRADGSRLHVRSASRTGYSDLGVNRRRVQRLFDALPPGTSE